MKASLRFVLALSLSSGFTGCSKPNNAATELAAPISAAGDPCALLSKGEVRAAFAGAESGTRDHSTDQYDIASCTWELPSNTLAVQTFKSTNSASDEIRGRMLGFLDPTQPGLRDSIQYDTVSGLGDEATIVAVKGDQARGILADTAMLGIRRGDRMVVLFTRGLVNDDPAATSKALRTLGGHAAARL